MKQSISKIALTILAIAFISFTWIGCSNDNKKAQALFGQDGKSDGKDTSAVAMRVQKVKDIFNNLPTTVQIMQLLKKSGSHYIIEVPSDPTVVSKFSSKQGQGINLGIYAADLAYAGLFDQKTDASLFLQSANKLATSLGIPDAFNENIISRIEANMANQDSLLTIILKDFWTTDNYLKKNDRQEVSAYLVSGGWVEGMYIATQLAAKTNSVDMANEIARQKISLQDLADMMKTYPNSPNMQTLAAQIQKIQDAFAGVTVDASSKEDGPALLTADQLKAITDAVTALRNQLTAQS
ncbi:MAG TPA: hypothetical protein VK783_09090 [Bacteroidia bacterium]|jgi:hypothetical protein|nr:hypothetical protein [Bacteroidia bacterium]